MTFDELCESAALDLLLGLERDGFDVTATDEDTLEITPASRLAADRLAQVRALKPELLVLVRACDSGVQARQRTFRRQLARSGRHRSSRAPSGCDNYKSNGQMSCVRCGVPVWWHPACYTPHVRTPWVPELIFREGIPYVPGVCFSCGQKLPPAESREVSCERVDGSTVTVELQERWGRCWPCALAVRLAVGADVLTKGATHADTSAGAAQSAGRRPHPTTPTETIPEQKGRQQNAQL